MRSPTKKMVRFALSLIFHRIFFCHTLSCFMVHSLISNSVLIQDGAKISKSLTKIIQQFYMLSKSVMKFQNIKIKCFSGSKQITIFLMNLNHYWNAFRWKIKIIFRMSKRGLKDALFLMGRTDQFWTYKRSLF